MNTKVCTKCGRELPATTEFFGKHKSSKNGLRAMCKECKREQDRKYNQNKRSINSNVYYHKSYYENNKEHLRQKTKEWSLKNPDKIREKRQRYYESGRNAMSLHKRRHKMKEAECTLTFEEWQDTLEYFNHECVYCGSKDSIIQDHIIPVSKGGGYTKENIIPACGSCNSSKRDTDMEEWYKQKDYFDESRLSKILHWSTDH